MACGDDVWGRHVDEREVSSSDCLGQAGVGEVRGNGYLLESLMVALSRQYLRRFVYWDGLDDYSNSMNSISLHKWIIISLVSAITFNVFVADTP